jgi:DNA-binding NtrC family response regulator
VVILHVDDEPAIRSVVRRALQALGLEVVSAEGVGAAKAALAERRDVTGAFLDVQLGDGNGLELYAWIGEHHPALRGRIAFITGSGDTQFYDPMMALGCPVLQKPFEIADLRRLAAAWSGADGDAEA